MDPQFRCPNDPFVTRQQKMNALTARICKLRWVGLEREAEQVAESACRLEPNAIMPFGPIETD